MARPNAILIGAIVLGPAIMAAEGYGIYRTHHRPPRRSAETVEPVAEAPEAPAGPAEMPSPPPARRPETPTPPAAPSLSDDTSAAVDPTIAPVVVRRQRGLYERRRQVVHDADEQVFDSLNLPDAQRAAIRAIDDEYGRTLASIAAAAPDSTIPNVTVDNNAEQTRRTAIAGVLGPDASRAFGLAERKAERRVRNRLRPDVVRGN